MNIIGVEHYSGAFVQTDSASGLRLFLREPRSLAVTAEPHARHEGETMHRKASSVLDWLKWILELPEDGW